MIVSSTALKPRTMWQPTQRVDRAGGSSRAPVRELVRLRWIAIAAQAATIAAVAYIWSADLALLELFAILVVTAATNMLLPRLKRIPARQIVGATVLLDVLLLTGLLALTGGPANPFSVLYLIHVMLAAIVTSPRWTWLVVAASSAGFGVLFFASVPLPPELGGHSHRMDYQSYSAHLQGMWLAYTLAAGTIAAFVSKLSAALRQEREERARAAHLLGLATLAAGAAHEIGNPLATIRVAASELELDLSRAGASREVLDDLVLINAEVGRAHEVLERMAIGAGELAGESPVATELDALLAETVRQLGTSGDRVKLELESEMQSVRWPVQATTQALAQLIRNGLQASPPEALVRCKVWEESGGVALEVSDQGQGMSPAVLERIGEPFFTTRPGEGMGLGIFIARSLIEHLGGQMNVRSSEGDGTSVSVWLPARVG